MVGFCLTDKAILFNPPSRVAGTLFF